jgi:ABC-2 type transport system permease protein
MLQRLPPGRHHTAIVGPYDFAAGLMMATIILVSVFYCADALHSERRDRSILFWKSLPVSDLTTVLAKVSIPLVVLPLIACVVTAALWVSMLLLSSAVLLGSGVSVSMLWAQLPLPKMWLLLLYHLFTAHALWPLPVYCWLLLVSGWARRAVFLWAALPVVAIAGLERIAFHTAHFLALVGSRLIGGVPAGAFGRPDVFPTDPMAHVAPAHFLGSPGLWIGLAVAAAFVTAAVWLRRYKEPI